MQSQSQIESEPNTIKTRQSQNQADSKPGRVRTRNRKTYIISENKAELKPYKFDHTESESYTAEID
jgi:hypothetical protein